MGDLGLAAVALAKSAIWLDESDYLDGACACYDVAERLGRHHAISIETAPVGWGAAVLYHVTRRRRYYDAVRKLVNYMVEQQTEEGYWPVDDTIPTETARPRLIDRTALAALLLNEFMREIQ